MRLPHPVFGEELETTVLRMPGSSAGTDRGTNVLRVLHELRRQLGGAGEFHRLGRSYIDCGTVLELAGCEVTSPLGLVRLREAMHLVLERCVRGSGLTVTYANLAHGNLNDEHATRGHHLNYCAPAAVTPEVVRDNLLSLLVTQCLFGGGGAIVPGVGFVLSGRAVGIRKEYHPSGTQLHVPENKALVNGIRTAESFAEQGFVRQMITCLDTVRSHRGIVLTAGIPALGIWLLSHGVRFLRPHLAAALVALRQGNTDLGFTLRFACTDGRERSLLQIERAYQRQFAHALQRMAPCPDWAPQVLRLWQERNLQMSTGRWLELDTRHDAPMKYTLLGELLERRGLSWRQLGQAYRDLLNRQHAQRADERHVQDLLDRLVIDRPNAEALPQWLAEHEARQRQPRPASPLDDLVAQVLFADHYFSAPGGLFDQEDRAGHLDHRLVPERDARRLLDRPLRTADGLAPRAVRRAELIESRQVVKVDWAEVQTGEGTVKLTSPLG